MWKVSVRLLSFAFNSKTIKTAWESLQFFFYQGHELLAINRPRTSLLFEARCGSECPRPDFVALQMNVERYDKNFHDVVKTLTDKTIRNTPLKIIVNPKFSW